MTLRSATPVLRVSDYPAARDFYAQLGFEVQEEGGDPPRFGILKCGDAVIYLDAWDGADKVPSTRWSAYFHSGDLNAVVDKLNSSGIAFEGPVSTVYGMREITVTDPDGNRLCFGQDA